MDAESIKKELRKKLDPANVKPPPKGKYGDYIEGWFAIAEANRIFGEDGWSYSVPEIRLTNENEVNGKWAVGYMATVNVSAFGVTRGDVGHGQGHGKSLGDAHDSAVKEAVTDALKRALRTYGNPFGLALYDKTKANVGVDYDPEPEIGAILAEARACKTKQEATKLWESTSKRRKPIYEGDQARYEEFKAEFGKIAGKLHDDPAGQAPGEAA